MQKLRIFIADQGQFISCSGNLVLYLGGFRGNCYNHMVAEFIHDRHQFLFKEVYEPTHRVNSSELLNLGRIGCTFYYEPTLDIIAMFGGMNNGNNQKQKHIYNDLIIYDVKSRQICDHVSFSELYVKKRANHSGFKIGKNIYAFGGITAKGVVDDLLEINLVTKDYRFVKVNGNVPKLYSSAMATVFYESKMDEGGNIDIDKIVNEIDWSKALMFIKFEGIYMFGGKDEFN